VPAAIPAAGRHLPLISGIFRWQPDPCWSAYIRDDGATHIGKMVVHQLAALNKGQNGGPRDTAPARQDTSTFCSAARLMVANTSSATHPSRSNFTTANVSGDANFSEQFLDLRPLRYVN